MSMPAPMAERKQQFEAQMADKTPQGSWFADPVRQGQDLGGLLTMLGAGKLPEVPMRSAASSTLRLGAKAIDFPKWPEALRGAADAIGKTRPPTSDFEVPGVVGDPTPTKTLPVSQGEAGEVTQGANQFHAPSVSRREPTAPSPASTSTTPASKSSALRSPASPQMTLNDEQALIALARQHPEMTQEELQQAILSQRATRRSYYTTNGPKNYARKTTDPKE